MQNVRRHQWHRVLSGQKALLPRRICRSVVYSVLSSINLQERLLFIVTCAVCSFARSNILWASDQKLRKYTMKWLCILYTCTAVDGSKASTVKHGNHHSNHYCQPHPFKLQYIKWRLAPNMSKNPKKEKSNNNDESLKSQNKLITGDVLITNII